MRLYGNEKRLRELSEIFDPYGKTYFYEDGTLKFGVVEDAPQHVKEANDEYNRLIKENDADDRYWYEKTGIMF